MNGAADQSDTAKMRAITAEAITNHAAVCAVKMASIEENVRELTSKISELTKTVNKLTTSVAVLKTRWQLFAIVGALIGVGGTLVGILIAIFD